MDQDALEKLKEVDIIHDLVKRLANDNTGETLQHADHYLKTLSDMSEAKSNSVDRTVINKYTSEDGPIPSQTQASSSLPPDMNQSAFMAEVERDAAERAARRKVSEAKAEKKKKRANEYMNAGDLEHAIKLYSKAIEHTKGNMVLYVNRAMAYYRDAQYELSLKDCDFAVDVDPEMVKAHFHRGKALLALGKYNEALEAFATVVKLNSNHTKLVKDFEEQARLLLQSEASTAADNSKSSGPMETVQANKDAHIWPSEDLRSLIAQLCAYNGLQPPGSNKGTSSLEADFVNYSFFAAGLEILRDILLRGDEEERAAKRAEFQKSSGFTLLASSKQTIIKTVMHVEPNQLRPVDLPVLISLWQVAQVAVRQDQFNTFFVAKDTALVDLAIRQLRHFSRQGKVQSGNVESNHEENVLCGVCVIFLALVLEQNTALTAWLDGDTVPGQPKALQLVLLLLRCLRMENTELCKWRQQPPSSVDKEASHRKDDAVVIRHALESLLKAILCNSRFKSALCNHPAGAEWVQEWEQCLDCRQHLPLSSIVVIVDACSDLLQPNMNTTANSSVSVSPLKVTVSLVNHTVGRWCQHYLPLHADERYVPLLQSLAILIRILWRRKSEAVLMKLSSNLPRQMVSHTTAVLSQLSQTQVALRPSLLSVVDIFLPHLTAEEISTWCRVLDPDSAPPAKADNPLQFHNPFQPFSNIDSPTGKASFHEKLSGVIHILLAIVRECVPVPVSANGDADNTEPISNTMLGMAVKLLAIASQHEMYLQARLGDDRGLVRKLATIIDPHTRANGILVGNAALCLRHCMNASNAAAHLHGTDVMKSLLSQCNSSKIVGMSSNDRQTASIRSNCAILAGTLARSDAEHYAEFQKLRGVEIVRLFSTWEKAAIV